MKNDCRPKDEYLERMEQFFSFSDKKSCERVYQRIIETY